MSKVAQFKPYQFIDAGSLTSLANYASAALNHFASGTFFPGLIDPTGITLTVSGFSISAVLSPPFQILFQNGASSYAHGTINGIDTQTYTLNVSSFVPVSGTPNTAYIVASYISILQNQDAIIGPPPGHPDFNPNFSPYLTYSVLVDSMAVTATLTPPDNINFFELARTTLASGVTGIGLLTTAYQQQAQQTRSIQVIPTSGLVTLPPANLNIAPTSNGVMLNFLNIGVYTLPPVSQVNTQIYTLTTLATGNFVIIQASTNDLFGTNLIYGTWPTPNLGFPAIILDPGTAVDLLAANGYWQVKSGYPRSTMYRALLTTTLNVYVAEPPLGNDNNTGLTSLSPFATLQKAANYITQNYDAGAYNANINLSSGTYVGADIVSYGFNGGLININGAGSGSTTIVGNGIDGNCVVAQGPIRISFNYLTLQGSAVNEGCINCGQGAYVTSTSGLGFGNCIGNHINVGPAGYVNFSNIAYVVAGSAASHLNVGGGGAFSGINEVVTLLGDPFFSTAFIDVYSCGTVTVIGATWSGSASGVRANITGNGVLSTNGEGPTWPPGSSPIVSGSGGQYT